MPTDNYLIDTTILVDILRNNSQAIAWVNSMLLQERWVSVVTYFELLAGCRNRREQRLVAREMRQYHLLMLTEAISSTALSWFARFHLSHGVGLLDVLIGATALHQGTTIATLNMKHFTPLPGVRVERPY